MAEYKTYEYIWLDGYQPEANMRSKVKATEADTPPDWSFDGSSTQQAEGGSSDCLLLPVQSYANPNGHDIVMTEVQAADHTTHHLITEQQPLRLLVMNGGLVLNKNSFLQILRQASLLVGKVALLKNKENTTAVLVRVMLLEEKFLMHIYKHVLI